MSGYVYEDTHVLEVHYRPYIPPATQFDALLAADCTPVEAMDFLATQLPNDFQYSVRDWASIRNIDSKTLYHSLSSANTKIKDPYSLPEHNLFDLAAGI